MQKPPSWFVKTNWPNQGPNVKGSSQVLGVRQTRHPSCLDQRSRHQRPLRKSFSNSLEFLGSVDNRPPSSCCRELQVRRRETSNRLSTFRATSSAGSWHPKKTTRPKRKDSFVKRFQELCNVKAALTQGVIRARLGCLSIKNYFSIHERPFYAA